MMRSNARMFKLAENFFDLFWILAFFRANDGINIRVKDSIAKEMVVSFVPNINALEVGCSKEISENLHTGCMVTIYIGITSNIQ